MTRKIKKRIIAFIMALIILMTVIYVFYGKNWLAEQQYIQKQKNSDFLKNELIQKMLDIEAQSQEILDQILNLSYDIEIFKKQIIKLEKTIDTSFNNELIKRPLFDYKYLYLISSDKLYVLTKNFKHLKWEQHFKNEIADVQLLDANRILVINRNKEAICLNRNTGKEVWRKQLNSLPIVEERSIFQISLSEYKQLDSSLILLSSGNEIELIENITGKTLAYFEAEENIDHISDFDIIEKCVYFIERKRINKLIFNVKS